MIEVIEKVVRYLGISTKELRVVINEESLHLFASCYHLVSQRLSDGYSSLIVEETEVDPTLVARFWKQDLVVAVPTDSVYGVMMRASAVNAQHLLRLKQRPHTKTFPLMVSDWEMLEREVLVTATDRQFWQQYPSRVTVIMAHSGKWSYLHPHSVALRIAEASWLQAAIAHLGVPVLQSSANISGQKPALSVTELLEQFPREVDLIVRGRCGGTQATTIVDATNGYKVVRQGEVVIQ